MIGVIGFNVWAGIGFEKAGVVVVVVGENFVVVLNQIYSLMKYI